MADITSGCHPGRGPATAVIPDEPTGPREARPDDRLRETRDPSRTIASFVVYGSRLALRAAGMTVEIGDAHPRICVRRLRHPVRRPCGDGAPPRRCWSRGGSAVRNLARETARICLDVIGCRALHRLLDPDGARARPCAGALSDPRPRAAF